MLYRVATTAPPAPISSTIARSASAAVAANGGGFWQKIIGIFRCCRTSRPAVSDSGYSTIATPVPIRSIPFFGLLGEVMHELRREGWNKKLSDLSPPAANIKDALFARRRVKLDEAFITTSLSGSAIPLYEQTIKTLWHDFCGLRRLDPEASYSSQEINNFIKTFLLALSHLDKLAPKAMKQYADFTDVIKFITTILAQRLQSTGEEPSTDITAKKLAQLPHNQPFNHHPFHAALAAIVSILRAEQYQCGIDFHQIHDDISRHTTSYTVIAAPTDSLSINRIRTMRRDATDLARNPTFPPTMFASNLPVFFQANQEALAGIRHLQYLLRLPNIAMPAAEKQLVDTFIALVNAAEEAAKQAAANYEAAYTDDTAATAYNMIVNAACQALRAATNAPAAALFPEYEPLPTLWGILRGPQKHYYHDALAPHLSITALRNIIIDDYLSTAEIHTPIAHLFARLAYAGIVNRQEMAATNRQRQVETGMVFHEAQARKQAAVAGMS